jgi:3,4-dihydroxy 2-butanone 4-phosphate synthase/GTP cyclohydrolase II
MTNNPFSSIEEAILAIKTGKMIILVDDENRENEGDLVIAAEHITPEAINFMARFGRGLICLPMAESLISKLDLPMMTESNRSPYGTAFTVSIEAATGISTGISAQDRARSVKVAIDPQSGPKDIISPGHMFPLKVRNLGVLERRGQTEGSVDLVKLAGLTPAAVICEIINDDGTMSRRDQLLEFSKEHNILIVTIADLVDYRIKTEKLVEEVATTRLPIDNYGEFTMMLFANKFDNFEHFALIKEPKVSNKVPLVRIHSECITGDVFKSLKCDCGAQLDKSLTQIGDEGGVVVYLRQEGRGVGLSNKIKAYSLQEQGYDTVEANTHLGLPVDSRNYAIAFQILKYLGMESVRLITNNPSKISAVEHYGIKVVERVPVIVPATPENSLYLKTKQEKLGHMLSIGDNK